MNLYHYSNKRYPFLLSRTGQEKHDKVEGYGSDYNDHISFFFEKIPEDLPYLLGNEHEFWKAGTTIYEYVIPIDSLPDGLFYRVVESHEKTDLLFNKQDWDLVAKKPSIKKIYLKEIENLEKSLGYIGVGLKQLKKVISNMEHTIREDYLNMVKLHEAEPELEMFNKYAACVQHLMLYVGSNEIKYSSVSEKKLIGTRSRPKLSSL